MNALSTGGFQLKFLLTPLREGRLVTTKSAHSSLMISTHAPAGGATPRAGKSVRCTPYFYSRPCGRGDSGAHGYRFTRQNISTHAPAGGATGWSRKSGG